MYKIMIYPPINSVKEKVGSKYSLCIIVGKRARQLTNGAEKLSECDSSKEVTIAVNEVNEDKIIFQKPKKRVK